MIQKSHGRFRRTRGKSGIAPCQDTTHGKVCHPVHILGWEQTVYDLRLVHAARQRAEKQNAVNPGILIQGSDHLDQFFLAHIAWQMDCPKAGIGQLTPLPCPRLIRNIARVLTNPNHT